LNVPANGDNSSGWTRIDDDLLRRPDMGSTEKLILCALARLSLKEGYAWISVGSLAGMIGMTEKATRKALNRLIEDDHIERIHRYYDHIQTTNKWIVHVRDASPSRRTPPQRHPPQRQCVDGETEETSIKETRTKSLDPNTKPTVLSGPGEDAVPDAIGVANGSKTTNSLPVLTGGAAAPGGVAPHQNPVGGNGSNTQACSASPTAPSGAYASGRGNGQLVSVFIPSKLPLPSEALQLPDDGKYTSVKMLNTFQGFALAAAERNKVYGIKDSFSKWDYVAAEQCWLKVRQQDRKWFDVLHAIMKYAENLPTKIESKADRKAYYWSGFEKHLVELWKLPYGNPTGDDRSGS
jgi:hypothetical protein